MNRVVICGAGIAGLALAQRLASHGWDVVVVEKAAGPRTQGYMIDFFGPGYDAAEAMGILPRLEELGYRVRELVYVDQRGRRRASIQFAKFAATVGGRLLSLMRPDLELALRESLPDVVDLRYSTSIGAVEQRPDGVRVTLTDGSVLDADLLVGADGIHSRVRQLCFGDEATFLRYLGFHTAAFVVEDAELRAQVGDTFTLTDTVNRQLGMYGLRDHRVAVFTVHRTSDPTVPADPRTTIQHGYGSLGWRVPSVLAQLPPAENLYYDQVAQIVMPQWSRGRVALLGDACYAVSLLAGQGASLGIAGAFVLAEQLVRADSVDTALQRYEQLWRPVAEEKQQVARDGARWFVPASPTVRWLRRIAMKFAALPGFDRLVAGALAGKSTALIRQLHAVGSAAPGAGAMTSR